MNEAELLFTELLNCNRLSLYLEKDMILDRDTASLLASVLKRRISGEPIEYILGKTEFMGYEFRVTPDVFIPRPETEILVETVIKYATSHKPQATSLEIIDLGTGSGCIAISLAKFLSNLKLTVTDISSKALEIARYNAILNNVINKIRFIQSDLFDTYNLTPNTYDLVVSNPPYIPTVEIDNLQTEISYEPRIAIDGGMDGLDFYRRMIKESPLYLKPGGFLIMEMGFNQANAIRDIFKNSVDYKIVDVIKDYNHIDRAIVARRNG